jgi:NADH-quinone oxidoreductase subunit J
VSLEELAFLALGAIAVASAILALLDRELVHTIMWIAVFFVTLAGLYFLLLSPFLGVLQLGVYAGAVTILLLFGVMVTRKRIFSREAVAGIGPGPLALAALIVVLVGGIAARLPTRETAVTYRDPGLLSATLFSVDGGWLLLLGITMLAALAGAIYLVREGRE